MDGSAEEITFDEKGVCNFCHQAQKQLAEIKADQHLLPLIIEQVKKDGEGKEYDCIIGLSGGADSSTVLHHAVKLGLRPLCFSIDNGWNNPLADENIHQMVETLKVPFYRYTIDLEKFRDLQSAFIKAGVPNIEIPTDHVLGATLSEMADKYGIKWIFSGGNVATESIMPFSWGYHARDLRHIKAIYKWATGKRLTGLPVMSLFKFNYYKWIKKIKTFYLLDFLDYNRAESIKMLQKEYGYQDYHEKHCESYFTWWFQNFYLFEKFGFDKRKAHYSSLINSGQMTRKEAVDLVADKPVFPILGLEKRAMSYPKRSHFDFPTNMKLYELIGSIVRTIRKWK